LKYDDKDVINGNGTAMSFNQKMELMDDYENNYINN
jgi:hypothetical protein